MDILEISKALTTISNHTILEIRARAGGKTLCVIKDVHSFKEHTEVFSINPSEENVVAFGDIEEHKFMDALEKVKRKREKHQEELDDYLFNPKGVVKSGKTYTFLR